MCHLGPGRRAGAAWRAGEQAVSRPWVGPTSYRARVAWNKERTSDRVLKTPTSRDGAERGDSGKRRLSREAMAVNARKSGGAEGEEEGSSES